MNLRYTRDPKARAKVDRFLDRLEQLDRELEEPETRRFHAVHQLREGKNRSLPSLSMSDSMSTPFKREGFIARSIRPVRIINAYCPDPSARIVRATRAQQIVLDLDDSVYLQACAGLRFDTMAFRTRDVPLEIEFQAAELGNIVIEWEGRE